MGNKNSSGAWGLCFENNRRAARTIKVNQQTNEHEKANFPTYCILSIYWMQHTKEHLQKQGKALKRMVRRQNERNLSLTIKTTNMKTALIKSNHGNHKGFNVKWTLENIGTKSENLKLLKRYKEDIADGYKVSIISQKEIDSGFFNGTFYGYFPSCLKDHFENR